MFSIYLKNGFRFGAKIDFKNEEIKIAYQILKKYHSQFWFKFVLFPLCSCYFACFCTFKKKQPSKVFYKKSCSRESKWIWTNFETVVNRRWNQKQKNRHYNDKFFTYICLIFSSYKFLSSCLTRKRYLQWPHVMRNAWSLKLLFSPQIPFCGEKFSYTSAPTM